MTEYRRILLEGAPVQVVRHGDALVAGDGREVGVDDAIHLPPVEPTKIICVHLNYASRTEEFMTKLPAAPTYFQAAGDTAFQAANAGKLYKNFAPITFEKDVYITMTVGTAAATFAAGNAYMDALGVARGIK